MYCYKRLLLWHLAEAFKSLLIHLYTGLLRIPREIHSTEKSLYTWLLSNVFI